MAEQRLGDADAACEPHVRAMERRHQGNVRETMHPGADNAVRKPPVRVDDLGLEVSSHSDGVDEIGAEEADERELGGPRRRDVTRHVAGVREALEATRRISESFDANAVELVSY